MPTFYSDDIDIDPDDFISACSEREITELVKELRDQGYIKPEDMMDSNGLGNFNDEVYQVSLSTLSRCRHLLTVEEESFINKLGEKYKYLG